MIQIYFEKCREIWDLARVNRIAGQTNLVVGSALAFVQLLLPSPDLHTMTLGSPFPLNCYDQLLDLSTNCLRRQVEYNARERVILTKLREISALEDEIMANHGSEIGMIETSTKHRYEEERAHISAFRSSSLRAYGSAFATGCMSDPRHYQ
jgi:hypothetical protein